MALLACGPASMLHDVRNAAAAAQVGAFNSQDTARRVWLHTENFG